MKRIKAILCVALSIILIFLCGCSFLEQKAGFIKMESLTISQNEHVCSTAINGDNALIYTVFTDNDEENPQYRLSVYNMRWNKLMAEKLVTTKEMLTDEFTAEFTDEKSIALCNVWESKATIYDLYLKPIKENIKYTPKNTGRDYDEKISSMRKKNSYVTDNFIAFESYVANYFGDSRVMIFENQPDKIFSEIRSDNIEPLCSIGSCIAYSNEETDKLTVTIKDYSSMTVINESGFEFSEPSPDDFTRIPYSIIMSDKYLLVPYNDTKGNFEGCCYWNYTLEQTSENFDSTILDESTISDCVNKQESEIEEKYDVDVVINPDTLDEGYPLVSEENELILYQSLVFIDNYFDKFPKGMLKEIYDYEDGFDCLRIYLCGKIESDKVNAYANNINGVNYVVFQTSQLSCDHIPHELMHAMEYRIWKTCGEKYDELYLKQNPNGFEYIDDEYYENTYKPSFDSAKYFARDYGMTDQLEDKATTFESIFCHGVNKNNLLEWDKNDPIYKKAEILCKAIREAYPSVQKADDVVWEKFLNE